jgi:two-component system sensor histidine kinase PilS (NtrC family)
VAVTSVLLPFLLVELARPDSFPPEATHYARLLASTAGAATLLYIGLLRLLRRHLVVHAYVQFVGDLLLITVMVYYLGGVASPFSLLYLVIIAVASTLLRRRAGVTVASCAFLLYAGLTLSLSAGLLPPVDGMTEVVSGWRVAYNLAIHFLGFYAMALLTSFLAHNATRAERELEVKSEHLADLQVVHRDVIQSISSGLITTDLAGAITSINQAGLAILRQADDRLIGAPVTESGLISASRWAEMTAVSEQQSSCPTRATAPTSGSRSRG